MECAHDVSVFVKMITWNCIDTDIINLSRIFAQTKVLLALRNNDNPSADRGVEIFFGYSSSGSQIVEQIETEMLTPSEYRNFLSMSEDNMALFTHQTAVIDKADFSPDSLKGYFTARLLVNADGSPSTDDVSVNFILSTTGTNDDDCWLIDSMLIRPSKLRRRRRR